MWFMYEISYWLLFWGLAGLICGGLMICSGAMFFLEWVIFRGWGSDLTFVLVFDWMSLLFGGVVLMISGCVFYYSVEYMAGDLEICRFGLLVLLFVLSMLVVIFSPSLIGILLGWDGLGLVSYCLVIYYQNYSSYNAGMITGITNRLGDTGLIISIGLLFSLGSWNFYFDFGGDLEKGWVVGLMILLAGFTKSAQLPFSAWLPAAMAAPTPVSALVHSSTLVTAGVYLFIRFSSVGGSMWWVSLIVLYSGAITMVMAGMGAVFETDLSKIIALSTLSQLGLMMVSIGVGNVQLAFFHLLIHAVFKSLLFLCGGSLIHSFGGQQDVRFMGGAGNTMSTTNTSLNTANFALCGVPFVAGFYSKDLILESWGVFNLNLICLGFVVVGTVFTCFYTLKFYFLSGVVYYSGGPFNWSDSGFGYTLPMMLLAAGGVVSGSLLFWMGVPEIEEVIVFGALKTWPGFVILVGVALGLAAGGFVGFKKMSLGELLYYMWGVSALSIMVPEGLLRMGGVTGVWFEAGWGEMLGGQGGFIAGMSAGAVISSPWRSYLFVVLASFIWSLVFSVWVFWW